MARYLILAILGLLGSTKAQSNYADQANNIEYQGKGLPEETVLNGSVVKLDDLSPIINLNRTKATLNCEAGLMQIELKFHDKFYGIAYADFDRNSACQVAGKGDLTYMLELPLKGCGTKQDPQRVFTNNIVVRFHPGLEMDGDEIITVVCRYPPPIVPPVPAYVVVPPAAPVIPAPLKGFQIMLIICGILFLSLLLLGLGVSYYCLRRRPVRVVRPFSSLGSDSEITQLTPSSLGSLTMFEGLKIPRAHAPVGITGSSAGSDTLPSDYPSESHSEEEIRSLPVSSAGSFENRAFIHDTSSFYSETYGHTQEQQIQNAVATTVPRLPLAVKEQVKVKKPPAPSPPSLSDTESLRGRDLSTIPEQREESVRSISPLPVERTHFTYVPELHPPPKHIQPAPTYNRILRRQQEMHEEPVRVAPARSIISLNTEMTDTRSVTECIDETQHIFVAPVPPPPPPIVPKQEYLIEMEEPVSLEPPIAAVHKPEITSHVVDDVFLRTITEKKTIEDIERHKRLVTEYHSRPKPPPQVEAQPWHSTTLTIPVKPEPPEWETMSDISSAPPTPKPVVIDLPPQPQIDDNKLPLSSPELVGHLTQMPPPRHVVTTDVTTRDAARNATQQSYFSTFTIPIKEPSPPKTYLSTFNIPIENPEVPNWNVLTRVLQPTELEEDFPVIESAETYNSQLTMTDKIKWRQIITTESTLRTLLTEAIVREDFERIRRDARYETLFEPPKWDTIIRILTPDNKLPKQRYKKKGDWDNRSRRSSLPTLYEYDSDDASSIRTLTREPMVYPSMPRRFSRGSYRSEADLRSMSEMTVDFRRPDPGDTHSEASSYYPERRYYDDSEIDAGSTHRSLARSLSQPSLARSASEFTERWVAPSVRYDTASEFTTPEGTPKSQRSSRILPYTLPSMPRGGGERNSSWQTSESRRMTQGPGTSTQEITREYRSEATTSFMGRPPKNWFADNDSEASFK